MSASPARHRLGRAIIGPTFGIALGHVITPGAAQAQTCNASPNPTPPSAVTANFANQRFGNTPPLSPYAVISGGAPGCAGSAGSPQNDGTPGSPGQPGAQIDSINTGLIIFGAPLMGVPAFTTAANIVSFGGGGGLGGQSGAPVSTPTLGGNGGTGGAGGLVTVSFNGTFLPDPSSGLGVTALRVTSLGGDGGAGGGTNTSFQGGKFGGDGGAGGAASAASLVASGTVAALQTGVVALSEGGAGGTGGVGDAANDQASEASGGAGGSGGTAAKASVQWVGGTIDAGGLGLVAQSFGGDGGDGGAARNSFTSQSGGGAGAGANGGQASATLASGTITINQGAFDQGAGVWVAALGGDGGAGGLVGDAIGDGGGSGGNGGSGGTATATVLGTVTYNGQDITGEVDGQGIRVQSNGGVGGAGAGINALEGNPGGGGLAGAGGSATLTLGNVSNAATVRASGNFAHGALVQSVGGAGGSGGQANFVFGGGSAGAGAAGGNGGAVVVTAPNASVIATGRNGIALLAHSIGGGGGAGGDATDIALGAALAIGGNGGLGGDGGSVTLDLTGGVFASTTTLGGAGILAQSIGGAGGSAGSATSTGVGLLSLVVGGDAQGGGTGGAVNVTSNALITTYGDHAAGVQAQSIGGGGGKGGSAVSFLAGILPLASVAVGGGGGGGGAAGDVSVGNTAQITTYGADAHGLLLQSVGGGGGSGGAAVARAVDISPDKRIPAISVSIATGGRGGAGNTGGTVGLTNSGLVTTAGDGAIGVMAQSIGGGGGTGGDSTAASYSGGGSESGLSVSIAVAVGGSGGSGGTSDKVTINNAGLIATLGQDAYGVFAQSVGGGGGTGGGGDASASSNEAKFSFATSIALGGSGGTGGHAGTVGLDSSGAITTRGDGAAGVFAQSVGGGGGAAGGGTATASGGNLSIAVGVGGSGGAGGNGNTATIRNSGSIVTRGTDAVGVSVQSIGGGGGAAGKGGATAGGVTTLSNAQALFDTLSAGLNLNQNVINLGDGILQLGQIGENILASLEELRAIFSQPQAGEDENGTSVQINVGVSVGGRGGAAGDGGASNATNTGSIVTYGAQSDAIYAQSIGGGGGSGGAASSTGAASDDSQVQSAIAVGGSGGAAGSGGSVTVVNGTGGTILTQGVAAFGIFAHSVGGGGGEGSMAGVVSGSFKSLSVGVGGDGGIGGAGGDVSVTTGDGTSGSSVTTTGKHGIGVVAQSVGGGGGLVRTMTTDQTFDPSKIINNPQGRIADLHGLALTFGGQNGVGGNGGQVQVTASGPVTTSGLDAHAVVAQSIGGGGGLVVGGQVNLQSGAAAGGSFGDGGVVNVRLQPSAVIATSGDGAHGIIAQSVGGGGGIAGDFSAVTTYVRDFDRPLVAAGSGNGGAVTVEANAATVRTAGAYAPAIFAQTVGGGGGLMNVAGPGSNGQSQTQYRGSAHGQGDGGSATVSLVNSQVSATGAGSAGILAQSTGQSTGQIQISLDRASSVRGGLPDPNLSGQDRTLRDAAAIRLLGGTGNTITNAGTIQALAGNTGTALAILADSPRVTVTNTGTINGDISIPAGGSFVDNQRGGAIDAPTTIALGASGVLRNAGTLYVGGAGKIGQTALTGDLAQDATGRLVVETNHATGSADLLAVQGNVRLGGALEVIPMGVANRAVTVLSATGGLTLDAGFSAVESAHVFRFDLRQSGVSLQVQPVAEFDSAASALGANQRGVAAHLQELFDSGASFDAGFSALAAISDADSYARVLNSLTGQTVGAIAAFRYSTSHGFVANMLDGCPTNDGAGRPQDRSSCVWARFFGSHADQDETGGLVGYRTTARNFHAGYLREVAPGWFLGGSFGYESSEFRGDGGTSQIKGDSLLIGATLQRQVGSWQVSGAVDFGYGAYESRRSVSIDGVGGTASATPHVWHTGAHARFAYRMALPRDWYAEPRLDLNLVHVRGKGYTESGAAPFDLAVESKGTTTFAAVPAVEVGRRLRLGEVAVLRAFASAGVKFHANDDWKATARFAGQSVGRGFQATTPIPGVLGRFSLGADLSGDATWEFRLQYTAEIGDSYASHVGMARLSYRF